METLNSSPTSAPEAPPVVDPTDAPVANETRDQKKGRQPREKDKDRPARQTAGGQFAALKLGSHLHFVLTPQGREGAAPEDRLLVVTHVVSAKKGIVSGVVYPQPGDFHKNVNPGAHMTVLNVPFHPGPHGDTPEGEMVPGTWHFEE